MTDPVKDGGPALFCHACGHPLRDPYALGRERISKFSVGDRVRHPSMGEGSVAAVGERVCVTFDHVGTKGKNWTGEYDAQWFRDVNTLSLLAAREDGGKT